MTETYTESLVKLMASPVGSILRRVNRDKKRPYNILTGCTHPSYETSLCKTGHNFYAFNHDSFVKWTTEFRKIPDNYIVFDKALKDSQIPNDIDFDFILSQNKFGQFQVFSELSKQLHIPILSLEHTLPPEFWPKAVFENARGMTGNINVFISDFSKKAWGFDGREDTRVIHHGIDTELFNNYNRDRDNVLCSVVNDWVNRDYFCGYKVWEAIVQELPIRVYGDNPGLSVPTKNVTELVNVYNASSVFLNTSIVSPIPTALLEAMACGCAVVSTATCMIPSIIEHGVDGLISNDAKQLKEFSTFLLGNPEEARKLGNNARKKIQTMFGLDRFVNEWNAVFDEMYNY